MKRHRRFQLGLAMIAALWLAVIGAPVLAQDGTAAMVKATDAPGVLSVIKNAGFKAEFLPRENDDDSASVEITTDDGPIFILFADCDEAVPAFCESLVLSTVWNRTTPIADSAIAEANRNHRYVSIWKNEKGDPTMQWAILTSDNGIAAPLFLNALQRFLGVVGDFDAVAFEGDETAEKSVDASPAT